MFQPEDLPILQDLQLVVGDDFSFPFFLGIPTSGYSFYSVLNIPASGLGVIPFSVANNDQVNGGVSIYLANALTATFPAGSYPWSFQYQNLQGLKTTFYQGTMLVLTNV